MILRSVIKHVRDQNWVAVGLDFLIVVVGVFIGIQVSNWNDDRAERSRESGILAELSADLCADLTELERTSQTAILRFNAQAAMLERALGWRLPTARLEPDGSTGRPLPHPEAAPVESAAYALYAAQRYTTFDPERAGYDGLVSSNEILLIRDNELVDALQRHYARVKGFNDNENTRYRATMERLLEALARNGLGTLDEPTWETLDAAVVADLELQGILKHAIYEAAQQQRGLDVIAAQTERHLERLGNGECP